MAFEDMGGGELEIVLIFFYIFKDMFPTRLWALSRQVHGCTHAFYLYLVAYATEADVSQRINNKGQSALKVWVAHHKFFLK